MKEKTEYCWGCSTERPLNKFNEKQENGVICIDCVSDLSKKAKKLNVSFVEEKREESEKSRRFGSSEPLSDVYFIKDKQKYFIRGYHLSERHSHTYAEIFDLKKNLIDNNLRYIFFDSSTTTSEYKDINKVIQDKSKDSKTKIEINKLYNLWEFKKDRLCFRIFDLNLLKTVLKSIIPQERDKEDQAKINGKKVDKYLKILSKDYKIKIEGYSQWYERTKWLEDYKKLPQSFNEDFQDLWYGFTTYGNDNHFLQGTRIRLETNCDRPSMCGGALIIQITIPSKHFDSFDEYNKEFENIIRKVKEVTDKHGNIKVGKNQIFEDDGAWTIEVFECEENGETMYSVFDAVESKEQARNLAKVVTKNNVESIREKLRKNPNYLKPEFACTDCGEKYTNKKDWENCHCKEQAEEELKGVIEK